MIRDQADAFARSGSLLLGLGVLFVVGQWIGWRWVGAFLLIAIADFGWCTTRLPARWRPW